MKILEREVPTSSNTSSTLRVIRRLALRATACGRSWMDDRYRTWDEEITFFGAYLHCGWRDAALHSWHSGKVKGCGKDY